MRTLLLTTSVMMMLVLAVGCANKGKVAKNDVLDVNVAPVAPREPELAYAGPLTGVTHTPAPAQYDATFTQTPTAPAATAGNAGGSYTVKKGDTLFAIAKATYGNGNQWQKITSANPGLSPTTLKAGQRIVIP